MKEMRKYDWNKKLYRNEGVGKDWVFSVGLFSNKFNEFKTILVAELHGNDNENSITNQGERFYKLVYNALCKLYKIN